MILKEFHDFLVGGHAGIKKTLARIAAQYFWKGMAQDVQQYMKNCINCMNLNQQIIQWCNTSYKIGTDYLVNLRITSSRHK